MAALDWSECPAVESIPGKVSGSWVFKGTRTPVAVVFENLEDGMTIDEVMEQFPVSREQQGRPRIHRQESRCACTRTLMRVLFDNGTPRGVAAALADHILEEARSRGSSCRATQTRSSTRAHSSMASSCWGARHITSCW
jgi:uncharacterized protein (DUF433 family)